MTTPIGTVRTSLLARKISAYRNSFWARVKAKMPAESNPGVHSGKMIRVIAWNRLAPSIRADSSSSRGTLLK